VIVGAIIAEFACARDAQLFAGLKREAGEPVAITAGINHMYAVRTASDEHTDRMIREGLRYAREKGL
jgi:hypothetical protein